VSSSKGGTQASEKQQVRPSGKKQHATPSKAGKHQQAPAIKVGKLGGKWRSSQAGEQEGKHIVRTEGEKVSM